MNVLIWITAILIIASKFMDCYTTAIRITNIRQEQNPVARKMMERIGIHTTLWGVFGLSVVITGLTVWILFLFYSIVLYKVTFIVLGSLISWIQFSVAHTNKTRRLNFVTKWLGKIYGI